MPLTPVPDVHPGVIAAALADARATTGSEAAAARLIVERGLRDHADGVRQVLAAAALPGATWHDLVERATGNELLGVSVEASTAPWWSALGRITMLHAHSEDDHALAAQLFDKAHALDPQRPFARGDYLAAVQALWDTGQWRRVGNLPRRPWTLDEGEHHFTDLNVLERTGDMRGWLALLNSTVITSWGLAPVRLDPQAATRFDGLAAEATPGSVDGPLITVIMSTYQRGGALLTAVRSILDQTWKNLEVILVDDCSGAEHETVLESVSALDSRVTVLRQQANSGTYAARNRALQQAQGEFVTFQDDDDWSHPERLERQVRPLIEDSLVHSTLSHSVQADDDLTFRYAARRTRLMNSSSLMFRCRDLDTLGGFDSVRKGADTEFIRRLRIALPGRQELLDEPLAFVRLTGGSLSRADFRPGWNHPTRSEYAEAADWWHRSIQDGASARMTAGVRPFPAPERFLNGQGGGAPPEFDVVIAADFASGLWRANASFDLLTTALEDHHRVGVLVLDDPVRLDNPGRTRVTDEVRRLINDGVVQRVFTDEKALTNSLVVADSALLQFVDQSPWTLEPDRVHVVCEDAPVETGGDGAWSLADASATLSVLLPGASPVWVAASGPVRDVLEASGLHPASQIVEPAAPAHEGTAPRRLAGTIPVIGRIGSSRPAHWPTSLSDLATVYPDVEDPDPDVAIGVDVRVLGSILPVRASLGAAPSRWLRFEPTDVTLEAFIGQLDIYAHFSAAPPTTRDLRSMLRAVAAGRVVVIDAAHAGALGEGAMYCTAAQLPQLAADLHQHSSRYQAQVDSARAWMTASGRSNASVSWRAALLE